MTSTSNRKGSRILRDAVSAQEAEMSAIDLPEYPDSDDERGSVESCCSREMDEVVAEYRIICPFDSSFDRPFQETYQPREQEYYQADTQYPAWVPPDQAPAPPPRSRRPEADLSIPSLDSSLANCHIYDNGGHPTRRSAMAQAQQDSPSKSSSVPSSIKHKSFELPKTSEKIKPSELQRPAELPDQHTKPQTPKTSIVGDVYLSSEADTTQFVNNDKLIITPDLEEVVLVCLTSRAFQAGMVVKIKQQNNSYKVALDSKPVLSHLVELARLPPFDPSLARTRSDGSSTEVRPSEQPARKDKRRRATIALTNLVPHSESIRRQVCRAGLIPVLLDIITERDVEKKLKRLAIACLSNLSIETKIKEIIGKVGAIPVLTPFLDITDEDPESRAAVAHTCACLWSLMVGVSENKRLLPKTGFQKLLAVCRSRDPYLQYAIKMACGCVGELCIGNERKVKDELYKAEAVPALVCQLESKDQEIQRLAASALCNLTAKNENAKKSAKEHGLIAVMSTLVKKTRNKDTQYAAAGCLYNITSKEDLEELRRFDVIDVMKTIPMSENIWQKLDVDNSIGLGRA